MSPPWTAAGPGWPKPSRPTGTSGWPRTSATRCTRPPAGAISTRRVSPFRTSTEGRISSAGGGRPPAGSWPGQPQGVDPALSGSTAEQIGNAADYGETGTRFAAPGGGGSVDSATGDSNLYQWVEGHARERPDSVAVTGVGPSLTWAQLVDTVDRVSGGLASLGVEPGDVVAAQLPNIPEFLILLLAAVRRGAILQTLHMPYREAELESLLRHGRASAVVVPSVSGDRRPVDELLSLKSSLPDLRHVITVGEATPGTSSFG
ncbi:MAG TPA: hypothetical protein ENI86_16930, partial [Acidimicrobiales bacterium]|nr:hypothetical protein [Acidimicrobiales bacterium]